MGPSHEPDADTPPNYHKTLWLFQPRLKWTIKTAAAGAGGGGFFFSLHVAVEHSVSAELE